MGKEYRNQRDLNQQQYEFEHQEGELSREFNSEEAEKARAFEESQRLASQAFQSEEWDRQFDAQNAYNTPAMQAKRLREAGLNPAVYFGGSGSVTGVSSPSVSAPSGGSAPSASSSPVGHSTPQATPSQLPAFLTSAGSFLNQLANAGKSGMETASMAKQFELQYNLQMEDYVGKQVQNAFTKLQKDLYEKEVPYKLKESIQNVMNLEQQKILLEKQGKVFEEDAALKAAQRLVQEELKKVTGTQGLILRFDYDHLEQTWNADMQVKRSQSAANLGSAAAGNTQARLNVANAVNQEFMNDITSKPEIKNSLCEQLKAAGTAAKNANKISEKQADLLDQQIAQLQKATDNYEIQMWSGIINQTINTLANAAGEFSKFGMVMKFMKAQPTVPIESGRGYFINNDGQLFKRP